MKSAVRRLRPVPFPEFTGERVYMVPFVQKYGLPVKLARWQDTIDAMIGGYDCPGTLHLMIDQAEVVKGCYHRKPGLHCDGKWNADTNIHGHTSYKMRNEMILMASNVTACAAYEGNYEWEIRSGWPYNERPPKDGDCSRVDVSDMRRVFLDAGIGYAMNSATIHESLPMPHACKRQLVRINIPGMQV